MLNSKKYVPPQPLHVHVMTGCIPSAYIISIAVANKVKSKFYDEDLPVLENVSVIPAIVVLLHAHIRHTLPAIP